MKKFYISVLIILCMLFSACADSGSVADSGYCGNDSTQSTAQSSENSFVPSELALEALGKMSSEKFFTRGVLQEFYDIGYHIDITDRKITDYNRVNFSMVFADTENNESRKIENLTAYLAYDETDLEMSLNNMFVHGLAAGVCGDEIVIGELDRIHVYDADTLTEKDSSLSVTFPEDEHMVFHDILKHGNIYILSYTAGITDTQYISGFNNDGAEKGFMRVDKDGKYSLHPINLRYDEYASPDNFQLEIRGDYPDHIFAGFYGYDFADNALFSVQKFAEVQNDDGTFILEKWTSRSTTADTCWRITNIVNGKVTEVDTFNLDVNYIFGTNQETNSFADDLIVEFAHENRDMIVTCPHTETTLILDRGSDTGQVVYNPTTKQLKTHDAVYSRDNRYTIYSGASMGGGDGGASQKILRDSNAADVDSAYRYIDTVSIYDEIGFFSNNDIWVLRDDDFIIYEKGMPTQQPKFVMSRNLPLGKNINDGDVWGRIVVAARRDPEKQDYIAMYLEFPDEESYDKFVGYEEGFSDGERPTYKLAVLDTEGKPVKVIDTGVNGYMRLYDFADVSMYMEKENLIHFEVKYKDKLAEATVNIVTDEVNILYDALTEKQ